MSEQNPVLNIKGISKKYIEGYETIEVLKNIDLKIYNGKWHTLYGVSGSGKTTLLNIIAGLEKPDLGQVFYNETDIYAVSDIKRSMWRNNRIGFVFQMFHLITSLNVKDNILLPLMVKNKKRDSNWYNKVIDMLDIHDLLSRYPFTLSGGEKQRVAIARAMINKPEVVIADEPTGNLDQENSLRVMELLDRFRQESSAAIVLATHEKDLIDMGDYHFNLAERQVKLKGEL